MRSKSTTEEVKCDIVIVGAGGAGMAAAVAATEEGVKDIVLLEERIGPGGNTAMAAGLFAVESPAQKRLGIRIGRDEYFRKYMDYCHWKVNPSLVRVLINKSADTIRWLEEMGVVFGRVFSLYANQPATFHYADGSNWVGAAVSKALARKCQELGIRLMRRTAGKRLLTDAKGNVTGVEATTKEKKLKITAKCVIIATGGCLGNKEMLKKYYPDYSEQLDIAGLLPKGDGIRMGMEVGAAIEGMGTLEMNGPDFEFKKRCLTLCQVAIQPWTLWVNKRGERFTDESIANRHFGESSNCVVRQPGMISYTLFDTKIKQHITEVEQEGFLIMWRVGLTKYVWKKDELPELDKLFQKYVDLGRIKISDSWDEIAKWMGAAPKVLKATVDEYNSFCDQGYDENFVKERRHLMPLRTPPYYAMETHTHVYNTVGGLKVNHRMEVLNKQDNPIRGLYATGMDMGGWETDTYNAGIAGHSIGFAVNSGRIAGEIAAEYVLGGKTKK